MPRARGRVVSVAGFIAVPVAVWLAVRMRDVIASSGARLATVRVSSATGGLARASRLLNTLDVATDSGVVWRGGWICAAVELALLG
jgi:hypothetical protein